MLKLIGITGKAGAGKTTFAKMLVKHLKQKTPLDKYGRVIILPFSATLKDFALYFGWNGKKDARGRRLLQLLGTDCGRECIDPDIWIKKWWKDIQKFVGNHIPKDNPKIAWVIIDDVRFGNEAEYILKHDGKIFHIFGRECTLSLEQQNHPSEVGIPSKLITNAIDNSSSLEWLDGLAEQTVERWLQV